MSIFAQVVSHDLANIVLHQDGSGFGLQNCEHVLEAFAPLRLNNGMKLFGISADRGMLLVELCLAVYESVQYLYIGHVISPAIAKMLVSLMNLSPNDREVSFSYLIGDSLPS